jgi:hypothetical protein
MHWLDGCSRICVVGGYFLALWRVDRWVIIWSFLVRFWVSLWCFVYFIITSFIFMHEGLCLVVATVPGYPAAVRVWNQTGPSSLGCYPEDWGTHQVRGQVGTGLRHDITVHTSLAPTRYLSSDRIAT